MDDTQVTGAEPRYQIGECIGRGGVGAVFRAWDERLRRWVAVKRLSAASGRDAADSTERVLREANTLAALKHTNIVTVHDFGVDGDGPFVVMEFVEGETLEAVAERAPFDLESFVKLGTQSLAGLAAAHRMGLLHRDIKPGNLMLTWPPGDDFQVKILDFGLAKFAPEPVAQTMDHGDALFGSIYYMAPEQFGRRPLDARTDLYSLGCVFYFSLTGQPPFTGQSVAEVIAAHLEHRVYDLAPLRSDLPPKLCDWIMSLMNLDPADRPRDASDALAELRAVTRRNTSAIPYPVETQPGQILAAPRRGRTAVIGIGAVVAVAGAAFAGWQMYNKPTAATPNLALVVPLAATSAPAEASPPRAVAGAQPSATPAQNIPVPAAATPAASPVAGAPVAASTSPEVIDASDLAGLRSHLNRKVEVRGTVTGTGQSKNGSVLYLNFSRRPHEAVAVVFFVGVGARANGESSSPAGAPTSQEDLRGFVGKAVRVTGTLTDYKGDPQLVLRSLDQIRPE